MALEIYDGSNHDGIFNVLGKVFAFVDALNTARGSTLPTALDGAVDTFKLDTDAPPAAADDMAALVSALDSWSTSGNSLAARAATWAKSYLLETVNANATLTTKTLANALDALIDAMDGAYHVVPNVVSVSVSPSVSSTDWKLVATLTGGDGTELNLPLAETITVKPNTNDPPTLTATSETALPSLDPDWPGGSGLSKTVDSYTVDTSLLANGGFEDLDANNFPDYWIPKTGTAGTAWAVTSVEVQTVTIAGTPTSGFYYLRATCPDGFERVTDRLAYNASAATVQEALRKLPGLSKVTVTATGTSPNFTHTVTFEGVAGDVATMSNVKQFNTGTISHATTTTGSTNAYTGRGMVLTGDGSTQAELLIALPTLTVDTVYCLSWRHKISSGATGTVRWAVLDGVAGSVVNDSAGNANSLSVDISTLSTSWALGTLWIRVPSSLRQPAYLSIKATTAVANTKLYCLDEVTLVKASQLYTGGPFVAAFRGNTPPVPTETWGLVVANDRAGELNEWFDRVFGLGALGKALPTTGGTEVPNSVVL